jgi:hypothetical protein
LKNIAAGRRSPGLQAEKLADAELVGAGNGVVGAQVNAREALTFFGVTNLPALRMICFATGLGVSLWIVLMAANV